MRGESGRIGRNWFTRFICNDSNPGAELSPEGERGVVASGEHRFAADNPQPSGLDAQPVPHKQMLGPGPDQRRRSPFTYSRGHR
jgi:hypothetical protein